MAKHPDPNDLIPLRPVVFEVLLLLSEQDRHGYGIMQDLKDRSQGRWILGPGTLYRTLNELRDLAVIEPAERRAVSKDGDERRRYYRITTFGRRVATAEAERMASLVSTARQVKLLASRK